MLFADPDVEAGRSAVFREKLDPSPEIIPIISPQKTAPRISKISNAGIDAIAHFTMKRTMEKKGIFTSVTKTFCEGLSSMSHLSDIAWRFSAVEVNGTLDAANASQGRRVSNALTVSRSGCWRWPSWQGLVAFHMLHGP